MIKAILLNDTRVDHHHGCNRVVSAFHHLAALSGSQILSTFPAHCHLVLVNGEGSLHHDRPNQLALLIAAAEANRLGKFVALMNADWESNSDKLMTYLGNFDVVVAREPANAIQIQAFRVDCEVVPSMSLYMPAPLAYKTKITHGFVGFSDSFNPSIIRALWNTATARLGKLISIQYPLENNLSSRYQFIREAIGKSDLCNPETLLSILIYRYQLMAVSLPSMSELLLKLNDLSLLVSGRFHAYTSVLLMNTPLLAIESNTSKIQNFLKAAGLDASRLISCDQLKKLIVKCPGSLLKKIFAQENTSPMVVSASKNFF